MGAGTRGGLRGGAVGAAGLVVALAVLGACKRGKATPDAGDAAGAGPSAWSVVAKGAAEDGTPGSELFIHGPEGVNRYTRL